LNWNKESSDFFAELQKNATAEISGDIEMTGRNVTHAKLARVEDVRPIDLPCFRRADGEIVVAETPTEVPFAIARMFTLRAPKMAERGKHAHRACTQLMLCVSGTVSVLCDDGDRTCTFQLDRTNFALLVPPSIWNTVTFLEQDSVVVVLCDRPFEEKDYLRHYADFAAFRQAANP
jgi:hypothetical protein